MQVKERTFSVSNIIFFTFNSQQYFKYFDLSFHSIFISHVHVAFSGESGNNLSTHGYFMVFPVCLIMIFVVVGRGGHLSDCDFYTLREWSTGDSRWLELQSLEVLDLLKLNCCPILLLYKTKQIYFLSRKLLISPSSLSLEPRPRSRNTHFIVFYSPSLEVGLLVHTSQACNCHTC